MYASNNNVTMLEDLPDLEEFDSQYRRQQQDDLYTGISDQRSLGLNMIPSEVSEKYKKNIREHAKLSTESGMISNNTFHQQAPERFIPPTEHIKSYSRISQLGPEMFNQDKNINQQLIESFKERLEATDPATINCKDIAEHVKNCAVCGKLYHSDNTVYLIIIVFLSILCLLLIKKVLSL